MDKQTFIVIITSAAVGAVVSSVATIIGQWLDRSARRKELLLSKAIELAFARQELVMKVAEAAGGRATLNDAAALAAEYYQVLAHVMDKGDLPSFFKERGAASTKALNEGRKNKP